MERPARVRIRKRKPCTRARRRLFGWKVRLPLATAFSSLYPTSFLAMPSGRSRFATGLVCGSVAGGLAAGRRGPQAHHPWSQPYRRLSGDCLRVLTSPRRVKPGLPQRTNPFQTVLQASSIGKAAPQTRQHLTERQTPTRMQQNGWQPHGKLLASDNAVSGDEMAVDNEARIADRLACLDELCGLSPARRSRAVTGRLRHANDHPVHTCA
jgi:hypothetical protein